MEYYYDIYLNFNEYPINYYEWDKDDDIERVLKIPIVRINDIKEVITKHATIETDLEKLILCDGVNAIALELVDKHVAFLSCLSYEDEANICDIVHDMDITPLVINFEKKRIIPFELRQEEKMKKIFLHDLDVFDDNLLRYIYYDITNKLEKDIEKIKKYLERDIEKNFGAKYVTLFQNLCKYWLKYFYFLGIFAIINIGG